MSLIMMINFNHDQTFLKTKSRRLAKLAKTTKWRHRWLYMLKWGMVREIWYFQHISLVMLNYFNHHLHFGKTIFKCLKQLPSATITENQQYDVYKWRHMLDMGHGIKLFFFQNVSLIVLNNFNHDHLFLKTKFQGLKRQSSGKISENEKMSL